MKNQDLLCWNPPPSFNTNIHGARAVGVAKTKIVEIYYGNILKARVISNTVLKHLQDGAIDALDILLLNAILSFRTFPSIWMGEDVVMIAKRGKDCKLPGTYRPMSLLSNLFQSGWSRHSLIRSLDSVATEAKIPRHYTWSKADM